MSIKPYCINIDLRQQIIVITFKGEVSPSEVLQLLDDLYGHQDYDKNFPTLFDLSEGVALGYQMDVLPFVKKLEQFRTDTSIQKKIGVVVTSTNSKFMVNLFLNFAPLFNLNIRMFADELACAAWIKADPEDQRKIIQLLNHNKEELAKSLES